MRHRVSSGFFFVLAGLAVVLLSAPACRPRRGTALEVYTFVAAAGRNAITVVDLASFSAVREIPLGSRPAQLVPDPARRALYVMGEGGPAGLTVIDTTKLAVKRRLPLDERPQRLRLAPGGERLYFLDSRAGVFQALDPERLSHGPQIRLAGSPVDFDISPDGRWACVSLVSREAASGETRPIDNPGKVQVLDLVRWSASTPIEVGGEPASVAVRYDGRQAFVANRASRSVSVIDLAGPRLVAHLPLNARPESMRFKPDGGELFVSAGDSSDVVILSAYRDEIDQPMLAGAEPRGLAVTKDNHLLFVANSAANTVSVINVDDRRLLASVGVGQDPRQVVLTPDDQYALVLNYQSGDLAVIRTAAAILAGAGGKIPTLFTMIRVGSQPVDLAVMNK